MSGITHVREQTRLRAPTRISGRPGWRHARRRMPIEIIACISLRGFRPCHVGKCASARRRKCWRTSQVSRGGTSTMINWSAILGCASALAAATCCTWNQVTLDRAQPPARQDSARSHRASPPASSAMPSAVASQRLQQNSSTPVLVGHENVSDRHGRPIPIEYQCVLGLLDYLSKNQAALASIDVDQALRPDPAVLRGYLTVSSKLCDRVLRQRVSVRREHGNVDVG